MIVVSDTSALSNLALVDHLWLLEAIYKTVIIPDVVANELLASSDLIISAIPRLSWIQVKSLAILQVADQLEFERWVVERTFGWLNRYRRLSKDYEIYTEISEAMIYGALIRMLLCGLAS